MDILEISGSLVAMSAFIFATILHYRKPRTEVEVAEKIWEKIPVLSVRKNGIVYDPRTAAAFLAYHFSTFKTRWRGEMSDYRYECRSGIKSYRKREKVAFKLSEDPNDENFFMLYWWRNYRGKDAELRVFYNKESFLDEIYNHWGVDYYNQVNDYLGCETQHATATI